MMTLGLILAAVGACGLFWCAWFALVEVEAADRLNEQLGLETVQLSEEREYWWERAERKDRVA